MSGPASFQEPFTSVSGASVAWRGTVKRRISRLPDAATARCELCDTRPRQPLSTILIVDGPDGLPVPFLICSQCRRTLDELHALLEAASARSAGL